MQNIIWQTTQQSRTAIKVYVISGTTFSFEYSFRSHFETMLLIHLHMEVVK